MKKKYWTLFACAFQLSACTFGGGFVVVPLMRRKFVEELAWIGEEEMLDMTAIAQSAPGAIAVNAAVMVGYRISGIPGAMVMLLGTVMPPLLILSVISVFYQQVRENRIVNMAMAGMLAGVAAVICDVALRMIEEILRKRTLSPVGMLLFSFAAVKVYNVNILVVLGICSLVGAAETWKREKIHKEALGK